MCALATHVGEIPNVPLIIMHPIGRLPHAPELGLAVCERR
jgi:hypothetical protein